MIFIDVKYYECIFFSLLVTFCSFKLKVYIALYLLIKNYVIDVVSEAEDWSNACGMTHTKINY